MKSTEHIAINELCSHYQLEQHFFIQLDELGILEIVRKQEELYLHSDGLARLEKILRLYHDLEVNMEGIDVILNLLNQIEQQEQQLIQLRERLMRYEELDG
jgi:hypothetical protein